MGRVVLGARVTDAQAEVLRTYAEGAGITFYQATVQALETGIAALASGRDNAPAQTASASSSSVEIDMLRDAIEQLTVRAELTDRLTQRTLYAAGAAYAAALAGPGQGEEHKAGITQDARRIFDRQLAIAQEERRGE